MNILFFTYTINGFLMIALGIGLGIFLTRKFNLGWRLWWIGATTFVLSQIGHIPFNYGVSWLTQGITSTLSQTTLLVVNAAFLGVSSGLWEETARYIMYRWWAKDARSWHKALLAGAGHGGIEAVLVGALVLVAFIQMTAYRNADLTTIVPAEQLALAKSQIEAYWSAPWYSTLMGALERIFALCLHVANSVMVLQAFTRKQFRWLWAAVGWHALFNAVAIFANATWGMYITEAILGIGAIISLVIIFTLRQQQEIENPIEPRKPAQSPLVIQSVNEETDDLEKSRYIS